MPSVRLPAGYLDPHLHQSAADFNGVAVVEADYGGFRSQWGIHSHPEVIQSVPQIVRQPKIPALNGLHPHIVEVFEHYKLPTQVIAASIRHPLHCVAAAKAGAHIATVPYNVLMQMINHPLTDVGVSRFLADWKRVSQK